MGEIDLESPIPENPILHDGIVYVLSHQGVLVAVNADQQPCRVMLPQGFVPTEESFAAGQWQPETRTLGGCSGVILCGSLTKDPEERFVGGSF